MSDIDVNYLINVYRYPKGDSNWTPQGEPDLIAEGVEASIIEMPLRNYIVQDRSAIISYVLVGRQHSTEVVEEDDIWEVVSGLESWTPAQAIGRKYRVEKARLPEGSDWDTGWRCELGRI